MQEYNKIKAELSEQLKKTDAKNTREFDNIIAKLKAVSEAEKASFETKKTELDIEILKKSQKNDKFKFAVGVIAPLITAIALIFTLSFQYHQSNVNEKDQLQAREATEWRDLLTKLESLRNIISSPNPNQNASQGQKFTIPTLLKSFFGSERYGQQSREIASLILPDMTDAEMFQIVFPDYMSRTNWSNFNDVSNLLRGLSKQYLEDEKSIEDDNESISNFNNRRIPVYLKDTLTNIGKYQDSMSKSNYRKFLNQNLKKDSFYKEERFKEIVLVNNAIAFFLRDSIRPASIELNFSNCLLDGTDFSNIDFSKSNFEGAKIKNCDVTNCSFENVSTDNIIWSYNTAWWRMNKGDTDLIEWLDTAYAYNSNTKYFGKPTDDVVLYNNFKKIYRLK